MIESDLQLLLGGAVRGVLREGRARFEQGRAPGDEHVPGVPVGYDDGIFLAGRNFLEAEQRSAAQRVLRGPKVFGAAVVRTSSEKSDGRGSKAAGEHVSATKARDDQVGKMSVGGQIRTDVVSVVHGHSPRVRRLAGRRSSAGQTVSRTRGCSFTSV